MTLPLQPLHHLTQCLSAIHDGRHSDALGHLVDAAQILVNADAVALLKKDPQGYQIAAQTGLRPQALGMRFISADHPRLAAIEQGGWVRFDANSPLPDPYDNLVAAIDGSLPVHDCMGVALSTDTRVWGLLTLDSLAAGTFNQIDQAYLNLLAQLAAMAVALNDDIDLYRRVDPHDHLASLLGESPAMLTLKQQIRSLASTDASVLIIGETGTGKELVAQSLHQLSTRNRAPMVTLNCATLSKELAASELFGHTRGAFTGANTDKAGVFAAAMGGTLFLDEIGELDTDVQAQLLRVLQSGEYSPVGSHKTSIADVRVIAATHRNLQQRSVTGQFRDDLYYRLSVFELHVPALRERGDDVLLLAHFFAKRWFSKLGRPARPLSDSLVSTLLSSPWPGNIRQLDHAIARWVLKYNEPVIDTKDSHTRIMASSQTGLSAATEQFQRQQIQQALDQTDQNWSATARILQLDRANLVRLAKRLGLR